MSYAQMGFLDPSAKRPITVDLSAKPWLRSGDELASATVAGDGVTISGKTSDTATVSFFVQPTGTSGTATATVHVVTSDGEEDDITLKWSIANT